MTPSRSSRSIFACTVVRDRPNLRAMVAVCSRAFSLRMASSSRSLAPSVEMLISAVILPISMMYYAGYGALNRHPLPSKYQHHFMPEGNHMKDIVVIGAGKIGSTIARMLAHSGDYRVTVADRSDEQLAAIERHDAVSTAAVDIADGAALRALLAGKFAVLSAAPYHLTVAIA